MDLSQVQQAKYIKLGESGLWTQMCLDDGTLRLGYYEVPHDLGVAEDKTAIQSIYLTDGKSKGTASDHARQVLDFYQTGNETLWITFANGTMYWCIAHGEVEIIGYDPTCYPYGSRLKRSINGWHSCSLNGTALHISALSGRITKLAAYRQTICNVGKDDFEYLMHKVRGIELPSALAAREARIKFCEAAKDLIRSLQPDDFEILVDLIFANSGWRRAGVLGKLQEGIDLELTQPLTGERSIVQVKSKTNAAQLTEYEHRLKAWHAQKMFYVYHTATTPLSTQIPNLILMGPDEIADHAVKCGLVDWLIDKAA